MIFIIIASIVCSGFLYLFYLLLRRKMEHTPALIIICAFGTITIPYCIIKQGESVGFAFLIGTFLFGILVGTIPKLQGNFHNDDSDDEDDESTTDESTDESRKNTSINKHEQQTNHNCDDSFSTCPKCGFEQFKNNTECMWCGYKKESTPPQKTIESNNKSLDAKHSLEQVMDEAKKLGTQESLNKVLVAFLNCYNENTWMTYSTYTKNIQPLGMQEIQTIRTHNNTYVMPIYTQQEYCSAQFGSTIVTTSIKKIVDMALGNDIGICINYGKENSVTIESVLLKGVINMLNNNVQTFTNYGVEFRKYLVERGYKEFTPSGHPSTVGQYIKSIEDIILWESYTGWQDVVDNINILIKNYDIGGISSDLGARGHNTVINALKRFKEYLDEIKYNI